MSCPRTLVWMEAPQHGDNCQLPLRWRREDAEEAEAGTLAGRTAESSLAVDALLPMLTSELRMALSEIKGKGDMRDASAL